MPAPEPAPLDRLKGFQKTTWGTSLAEVKKILGGGLQTGGKTGEQVAVIPKSTVAGFSAAQLYYFGEDGKLYMVIIAISNQQTGIAGPKAICAALRKSLDEKYGAPMKEEEIIGGTKAIWGGETTILALICDRFASSPMTEVMLTYLSRGAAEAEPKVKSDDL